MPLDRGSLAKTAETRRKTIDVPEFGGSVSARTLSFKERKEIAKQIESVDTETELFDRREIERVFASVVLNEDGSQMYDPANDADLDEISEKLDPEGVMRVFRESVRFSGMTPEGLKQAKNG